MKVRRAPLLVLAFTACAGRGADEVLPSTVVPPPQIPDQAPPSPATSPRLPGTLFQLLDDMESGASNFPSPVGLASWFVEQVDAGGFDVQADIGALDIPRGTSLRAWNVRSGPSAAVDLRIDLHGPQFPKDPPYPDLSSYAGVAFWARAQGDANLVVAIEDDQVLGGRNYLVASAGNKPWFERTIELSPHWRRHIILFDDLRQRRHPDARLRAQAVWAVHFIGGMTGKGSNFWIDDLALLCRGSCPTPSWDLGPRQGGGLDDGSLTWVRGAGSSAAQTCAEIAVLTMAPLDDVPAGTGEKLFLRVRIPGGAAAPLWAWSVENLTTPEHLDVQTLDEMATTVAVPVRTPGEYRVRSHTHHPGMETCGAEVLARGTR